MTQLKSVETSVVIEGRAEHLADHCFYIKSVE